MQIKLPNTKLPLYRRGISQGLLGAIHTARSRLFFNPYRLEINLLKITLKEFFPDHDDLDEVLGAELTDVFGSKTVPVFPEDTVANIVERMLYTYDSEYRSDCDYDVWLSQVESAGTDFCHGSGKWKLDRMLANKDAKDW